MVFLNDEPGLSEEERNIAALEEARAALSTYWSALEGTIDPGKIEKLWLLPEKKRQIGQILDNQHLLLPLHLWLTLLQWVQTLHCLLHQ